MSTRPLEEHLREHYASKKPRAETVTRLADMTEAFDAGAATETPPADEPVALRRAGLPWGALGPALAAAACLLLAVQLLPTSDLPAPTIRSVAREVVLNHEKQLTPDHLVTSFAALAPVMGKLDFTPMAPPSLGDRGLSLVGARYCSIHGQIAAQLKLRDRDGRIHTLYETRARAGLDALPDTTVRESGLEVRLWQEAGLWFGLASPT